MGPSSVEMHAEAQPGVCGERFLQEYAHVLYLA